MSDGEIEIENSVVTDALPKDVVKEVGNVKLFNKWDYDVEVRDISLTYVENPRSRGARWEEFLRNCKNTLHLVATLERGSNRKC